MITASASSDTLVRNLEARALRKGIRYAEKRRQNRKAGAADWHSARSLWPNFTRG